jgi:hypothetical protein
MKRWVIIIAYISFFMCTISNLLYVWWKSESEFVPYLQRDRALYQTAEYLYTNPEPTPIKHMFYPPPGGIYGDTQYYKLCVIGEAVISEWIINGKHIPNWMYNTSSSMWASLGDPEDSWLSWFNCMYFPHILPPGLHLVKVEYGIFSVYFPYLPSYSYEWAFRIVPSPTPIQTPSP